MLKEKIFSKIDIQKHFDKWFEDTKGEDNFDNEIGFYDHEQEKFKENFIEKYCIKNDVEISSFKETKKFEKEFEEAENEKIKELAYDWYYDRLGEFVSEFNKHGQLTDQGIICAREIKVNDKDEFLFKLAHGTFLDGFDGLGVCWSWDHKKAEAHWGEGKEKVVLKGIIPFSAIDQHQTFWLNFNPSLGAEEAEIRVNPGETIFLIEIDSEPLPEPLELKS